MGDKDKKSDSPAMQAYYDGTAKHPGGRPTNYSPVIVNKALDYLNNYGDYGKNIPSIARLAQVLDTTQKTLYEWAHHEDKPEFSKILCQIKQAQEIELLENGLSGDYNSNITKLVLGKHGYHDRQEVSAHIETKEVGNNELARRLAFVLAKGVTVEHEPD